MATTPTAPTETDQLATAIVNIIAGLTNNVEVPVIESTAEAEEPFLAWPVIKQVFEALVSDFAGKLAVEEEGVALRIVFVVQADTKLYALGQSALALQKAQASGDPNAISTATQNAISQWGNIIHFGGTAPVQS